MNVLHRLQKDNRLCRSAKILLLTSDFFDESHLADLAALSHSGHIDRVMAVCEGCWETVQTYKGSNLAEDIHMLHILLENQIRTSAISPEKNAHDTQILQKILRFVVRKAVRMAIKNHIVKSSYYNTSFSGSDIKDCLALIDDL